MADAVLCYSADFETVSDPRDEADVDPAGNCYSYSCTIEDTFARTGTQCWRVEEQSDENNTACSGADYNVKWRSQLRFTNSTWVNKQSQFGPNSAIWIGFSVYIPTNYPSFSIANKSPKVILGQINNGAGGPEFEFSIDAAGNNFHVGRSWDGYGTGSEAGSEKLAIIPVVKGQWLDFIIYRERSLHNNPDGYVGVDKLWMNGSLVFDKPGDNARDLETRNNGNDNTVRWVLGHYSFPGSEYTGSVINFVLYYDAIKAAYGQGTNGYDLVDPAGSSAPTVLTVPDGFTAIYPSSQPAGTSYAEVDGGGSPAAWKQYTDTVTYPFGPGQERYIEGELQVSPNVVRTAEYVVTGLNEGDITFCTYVASSPNRSAAVPIDIQVDEGGGYSSIFTDVLNENGTVSSFRYFQRLHHAAGDVKFILSNEGLSSYVNTYMVAYKQEDGSVSSNPQPEGTPTYNYGTGTSASVSVPSGFAAGEQLVVYISSDADNGGGVQFTGTGDLTGRKICAELATGESDDYADIVYRVPYSASVSALTVTLAESANWTMSAQRWSGVNSSTPDDVNSGLSHAAAGELYHRRRSDSGGVVTSQAITPLTDGAVVITISSCNDKNGSGSCTGVSSDQGTVAFDHHSRTDGGPFIYATYQVVDPATSVSAETHTYTGVRNVGDTSDADGSTLRFSLQRGVATSPGITVPNSVDWGASAIADKSKYGAPFTIDPVGDAVFSGGSGSFSIVSFVANTGSYTGCTPVLNADGTVTISITNGFDGTASFLMTVQDSTLPAPNVESCVVSFEVVNTAPVAYDIDLYIAAGDTRTFNMRTLTLYDAGNTNATDADGDVLDFALVVDTDTTDGTCVGTMTSTYVLEIDASSAATAGSRSGITYQATDNSSANADSAIMNITVHVVTPVSNPTGENFDATVPRGYENYAIDALTAGLFADPDGLPLSITEVNSTACADGDQAVATTYGTIYNSGDVLYYTPNDGLTPGADLVDSITVTVSNGTYDVTKTLSLTIPDIVITYMEVVPVIDDGTHTHYLKLPGATGSEWFKDLTASALAEGSYTVGQYTGYLTLTGSTGPWPCRWVADTPTGLLYGLSVFVLSPNHAKVKLTKRNVGVLS